MSSSSTVGIALGCAVLIVMLSVMNGFESALKEQLLAKIPHGEIRAVSAQGLQNWQYRLNQFEQDTAVKLAQPFAKITGLAQRGKFNKAVEITAIDPQKAAGSELLSLLTKDQWQRFVADPNGILLGRSIVEKLQIKIGDKVQLLVPPASESYKLAKPITLWVNLAGMLDLGGELDQFAGFMHLSTATSNLNITTGAQGIQLSYHDPFVAAAKTREFAYQLQQAAYISDWTRTQGHLYQDIQLVRVVVYIALTLVIAVACFNIVSSLVMLINEKKPEIDMLLTMGATPNHIVSIFVIQGISNGIKGIAVGTVTGTILAWHLTEIVTWLENLAGIQLLSGDVYFVDYLPSEVHSQDILVTVFLALFISLLSVLFSAFKFARQPLSLR
ncbi:MAG: FtsX-like permease family protein [Aestuariibacter sp.]